MSNSESKTIIIDVDRNSICMADDVYSHRKTFEFQIHSDMLTIISKIEMDDEYKNYGGAIWAGRYNEKYKCIRDNSGNWLIDQHTTAKDFFTNIDSRLKFERNSQKCGILI